MVGSYAGGMRKRLVVTWLDRRIRLILTNREIRINVHSSDNDPLLIKEIFLLLDEVEALIPVRVSRFQGLINENNMGVLENRDGEKLSIDLTKTRVSKIYDY